MLKPENGRGLTTTPDFRGVLNKLLAALTPGNSKFRTFGRCGIIAVISPRIRKTVKTRKGCFQEIFLLKRTKIR